MSLSASTMNLQVFACSAFSSFAYAQVRDTRVTLHVMYMLSHLHSFVNLHLSEPLCAGRREDYIFLSGLTLNEWEY